MLPFQSIPLPEDFSFPLHRFSNAFSYYGLVLLTTELFQAGDLCSCESDRAGGGYAQSPECPDFILWMFLPGPSVEIKKDY